MHGRRRTTAVALLLGLGLSTLPAAAGPPVAEHRVGGHGIAERSAVSAYFFGDSLMAGTGASPRRPVMARVAAVQLGWDVEVDAWGGTGYTTAGGSPGYLDRLRRPGALSGSYDVVLLEGGTNDARHAGDPARVRAAVHAVVEEVQRRQPGAAVVLMGAYDPPPPGRTDPRRAVVDAVLADVARQRGLPFFSPLSGRWTQGRSGGFLHGDRLHPTARGYGVLGSRLAKELAALVRSGRISHAPQSASSRA